MGATLSALDSNSHQAWVAISTLSLLDNPGDANAGVNLQLSTARDILSYHLDHIHTFKLCELNLRVRNSCSIGACAPTDISTLSTGGEPIQTSVIRGATSSSTVEGTRPTLIIADETADGQYKKSLEEALLTTLKIKSPPTEHVVVLCGEGISVTAVSKATVMLGYDPVTYPLTPSELERQQLRVWLKGTGGLLVTSNLQFSGMEASTCVFITRKLVEETGARSGLLRATTRLVVVLYSEDFDPEEAAKRFLVKDKAGVTEKKKKEAERVRNEQPLAVAVDAAARKGNISRVVELQQTETSGIFNIIIIITTSSTQLLDLDHQLS